MRSYVHAGLIHRSFPAYEVGLAGYAWRRFSLVTDLHAVPVAPAFYGSTGRDAFRECLRRLSPVLGLEASEPNGLATVLTLWRVGARLLRLVWLKLGHGVTP